MALRRGISMIERLSRTAGVILCALLLATPVLAQTALGTLRGVVVDEQGAALPGVTVTVRHTETNTVQTSVTGAEGQFVLPNLRPGKYLVTGELSGFSATKQELDLRVGQDLTVNLTLKVGALSEAVEVVGRSVAVETQSTLATVITNKQIDDLPTVTRDFAALAVISPGATTSNDTGTGQGTGVSISGQRPFTNGIVVDGASNQMQFYGRQSNDFPQDWIQEFQVLTNSFSAEYGQAAGGMLNVITRSGANMLERPRLRLLPRRRVSTPAVCGPLRREQQPDLSRRHAALRSATLWRVRRRPDHQGQALLFRRDRTPAAQLVGRPRDLRLLASVRARYDHSRPGSADGRHGQGRPQLQPNNHALLPLDRHPQARYERRRDVAGLARAALTRSRRARHSAVPLWNVLANWSTTLSNRAFNEFRAPSA